MIYLDTHVVVWLYAGDADRLSPAARDKLETEDLSVSPVVQLELQFLKETGRIDAEAALMLESLENSIGLTLCDLPFARVITESIRQSWTRDPFDRIIVAQATARNATLLTKDRTIHAHYARALW